MKASEEYAVNARKCETDEFAWQEDVCPTMEEALLYAGEHPAKDGYYLSIECIEYDDEENELAVYTVKTV